MRPRGVAPLLAAGAAKINGGGAAEGDNEVQSWLQNPDHSATQTQKRKWEHGS